MIEVGLVGFGLGGRCFHVPVIQAVEGLRLAAIVQRTLLLERFGRRFNQSAGLLAFAVALMWALHPLQTEAVVYITQRSELMVGFFYLATLYCSLRYWAAELQRSRRVWLGLAILDCMAGMACKEVMVTAPLIVTMLPGEVSSGLMSVKIELAPPANAWLTFTGCM